MFSLSQTSAYAIRALTCLAKCKGEWFQAHEIASCARVPRPYLVKILHGLAQSELVNAKRGYRGGYALGRPAKRISLLDIIEAVEGHEAKPSCLMGLAECSDERACPVHEFWKRERKRISTFLQGLTLEKVATFEEIQLGRGVPISARWAKGVRGRKGKVGRSRRKGR